MSADTPASTRAFISVEINDATRRALAATQAFLKKTGAHVAWVSPENLHISLVFLGDTVADRVAPISRVLDAAATATSPFTFHIANLGTFGKPDSPRVVWAGVADGRPLKALHAAIAERLKALQIPLESRDFVPHLTLGRVKSGHGRREFLEAIKATTDISFGQVDATRVVLMRSVLKSGGAEYSPVHEARFTG